MLIASKGHELSIGVSILDSDHREISETLNELRSEALAGSRRGHVREILSKLEKFTLLHFALEEAMMTATHYPQIETHRSNHLRHIEQLNLLALKLDRDGVMPNREELSLLPQIHTGHIGKDDLRYGHWLDRQ